MMAALAIGAALLSLGQAEVVLVGTARAQAVVRQLQRRAFWALAVAGTLTATLVAVYLQRSQVPVVWAAIALPAIALFIPVRASLTALGYMRSIAIERLIGSLGRLCAIAALALAGSLTLATAAAAHVAAITVAPLLLLLSYRRLARTYESNVVPNPARLGAAAYMAAVATAVTLRTDQVLLLPLAGAQVLGFYAAAVALAELPLVVTAAMKLNVQGKVAAERHPGQVFRYLRWTAAGAICVLPLAFLLAEPVVVLLYGDEFRPAAYILKILLVAAVPGMLLDLLSAAMIAAGRAGTIARIQLATAAATLVATPVAISVWGGAGAALASAAAYTFGFSLCLLRTRAWFSVPIKHIFFAR